MMRNNYFLRRFSVIALCVIIVNMSACLAMRKHAKGIEPFYHPMNTEKYEVVEPVELEVSSFRLFWFFPVTPDLKIKETVNDAIRKKDGDNLIEMRTWLERQYWILGTVEILHINGIIVRYVE